tara:strand:+ start:341 stop:1249 length:909 start_codon:yes stop_codon:yes gene_type:complete
MSMRYQAGIVLPGYNPLKVPNAPTIGTATAGGGSASVTFTAPSDVGGGAITGYSVVSTPSGIIGTGASSPITVSGLSIGTAYTFKVFATNAYGPSPLSAASNSATPIPVIGSALGGGFFAGQISTAGNGIADYNLVVGPVASAQSASKQWKTTNTSTAGTTSVIDGPTNSSNMNNASHPAAQFCEAVNTGGFTDWYMPARNELEVCYYNLKPTTQVNNTSSGINANAVPARASNYTSGSPAQTSATDFQSTGAEDFAAGLYWSSTEFSTYYQAWGKYFTNGNQFGVLKSTSYNVRAIRRVAV